MHPVPRAPVYRDPDQGLYQYGNEQPGRDADHEVHHEPPPTRGGALTLRVELSLDVEKSETETRHDPPLKRQADVLPRPHHRWDNSPVLMT